MDFTEQAGIYLFHKERMNEFGAGTTGALGWKSDNSQLARFAMLEGIGNMNGSTVLDVGCGHGDLGIYLHEKYPQVCYAGIDIMEEFLQVAVERLVHLPAAIFYLGDFCTVGLPAVDYVIACGSLSYKNVDADYIYKAINKLFNTCRTAFGFNLLSSVDFPSAFLETYQPTDVINYCRTLTGNVVLHQGYFERDFTVWMYK